MRLRLIQRWPHPSARLPSSGLRWASVLSAAPSEPAEWRQTVRTPNGPNSAANKRSIASTVCPCCTKACRVGERNFRNNGRNAHDYARALLYHVWIYRTCGIERCFRVIDNWHREIFIGQLSQRGALLATRCVSRGGTK